MRLWHLAALLSFATLAGCADGPTKPAAQVADAGNKPTSCGVKLLGHEFRPGEDMLAVFSVKENAQWCFGGVRLSGSSTEGQSIVETPSHGQVRLVRQPGAIMFGYRPAPGFTGTDHFRIGVPAPIDTFYLSAKATVEP